MTIPNRKVVKRVRGQSESRGDRRSQNRETTHNREVTDAERVDMLRRTFFQSALPDIPPIEGYHVCWLTTQNPRDPIHGRMRLGYELIKASEIPGFEHLGLKTGDYPGVIGVNEMIAAKISLSLYDAFMREVHYEAPLREEEAIYSRAMEASEEAGRAARRGGQMKAPLIEAGTQELGQARDVPSFIDQVKLGSRGQMNALFWSDQCPQSLILLDWHQLLARVVSSGLRRPRGSSRQVLQRTSSSTLPFRSLPTVL